MAIQKEEIANTSGAGGGNANMAMPPTMRGAGRVVTKWKKFKVCNDTFNKLKCGKMKYERWSRYLNLELDEERNMYEYAKRKGESIIVIENEETGALKAIYRA